MAARTGERRQRRHRSRLRPAPEVRALRVHPPRGPHVELFVQTVAPCQVLEPRPRRPPELRRFVGVPSEFFESFLPSALTSRPNEGRPLAAHDAGDVREAHDVAEPGNCSRALAPLGDDDAVEALQLAVRSFQRVSSSSHSLVEPS